MIPDHAEVILWQVNIMQKLCEPDDAQINVRLAAIEYETKELLELMKADPDDTHVFDD